MTRATILKAVIVALMVAIPLVGPALGETTSEDLAKESKEALEAFKAYMVDKKNDAVAHGKELLKKTDAEIDKLQAKADEASGDAKEKRAAAAQTLDDLGDASADSWDDAKAGFTEAYKALYDAYKEAVANFK